VMKKTQNFQVISSICKITSKLVFFVMSKNNSEWNELYIELWAVYLIV
jgi:hypothetical protein